MPLWVVKDASFDLAVMTPRTGTNKALEVLLKGLAIQKKTPDPKDSIDRAVRQLSLRLWNDIAVRDAVLSFGSGELKMPEPPEGFEEDLLRVEKR